MGALFHTLIYNPLYNLLIGLYETISWGDFGIAIILTTILLKTILIPLSRKQIESQQTLQEVQPKIKALQEKYKDDKETQAKELMALYKREKINPFGGCLPLIVQIIFFIAIYRILIDLSAAEFVVNPDLLYSFIPYPERVGTDFLGIVDLTQPNIVLAVVTAMAQYVQMKMIMTKRENDKEKEKKKPEKKEELTQQPDFAQIMNKQMLYFLPGLTLIIGVTFGAGLILYWLASTLFMIAQQWYIMKNPNS